jgi:uncharacterized protein
MISPPLDAPLSRPELDRLEKLLASDVFHGDAMPLDALQGLFFAIASSPDPVAPERWMPAVLGESPAYENPGQMPEVHDLVMRFFHQCANAAGSEDFTLLLYGCDDGKDDVETWCAGYLQGVDLSVPSWYDRGDLDEVEELLFPFVVLAGEASEPQRQRFRPVEWRDLVKSCEESLGDAIVEVREYWRILSNPPTPARRESPKTGRNDPCPCGSGKKFKQCCGAPLPLD